jgi:hypothetical protein
LDTAGSPSLVVFAVHSISALALAAVVASPSGAPHAGEPIAATRLAEPAVMYGSLTDVCRGLDASPRHAPPASRITAGTALDVLRVDEARCAGFTLPMLEVRTAARHGYIAAAAAPLPLSDD